MAKTNPQERDGTRKGWESRQGSTCLEDLEGPPLKHLEVFDQTYDLPLPSTREIHIARLLNCHPWNGSKSPEIAVRLSNNYSS